MRFASYIPNRTAGDLLLRLLNQYRQERGGEFTCRVFKSELDLLCELSPGDYDALFLGELHTGLAEEISARDGRIRIVGITSSGAEGDKLSLGLWYCLPETMSALFLFPMLDRLLAERQESESAGMVIKTKAAVLHLPFARIEYAEVLGRTIFFHLTDGTVEEITGTFSDYEARLLQWPNFVKVHRAYIVNLRHIAKLKADSILTAYGCTVPVSERLYPQLRKDYLSSLNLPGGEIAPAEPPSETLAGYAILLVDNEEAERQRWSAVLAEHGCRVRTADTGDAALELAERERFDCVVLDVNMGREQGFDLCAALGERTGAPVVYLSTLMDVSYQERGFLTGGADYITKDVSPALFWMKLEKRIQTAAELRAELVAGELRLDLKGRTAYLQGQRLSLTAVEFDLLHLLAQHPGAAYSPEKLYTLIWGSRQWDDGHTVQLHISKLCRKLEAVDPRHAYIETVWGKGYRFVAGA